LLIPIDFKTEKIDGVMVQVLRNIDIHRVINMKRLIDKRQQK